ncbi:fumarylacetoacetate hydrolase family protein [Paludibaculum fermentans]|uniref:Fumarylacetoacetate hydrolase family protein n=2 Tax=Paludibaculum fermentans TaxID=1473598 RepID=A0A7S7NYG3_PALFE|nr:fumarylacetoacetate hydrolase family protein [Paludibaculum fermentans]
MSAPDSHPGVLRGILQDDQILLAEGRTLPLAQARLLPAVSPTKIVCVGRNYAEHAKELGNAVPTEPLIFMKPPSSLNGHLGAVVYPKISQLVSFEGEVGIIIGRRARRIKQEEADAYIAGYTIVNDMTARDLQKKDGQWTRGKGFDTFCPVGPCWVPREEIDFQSLRVTTRVNGEVKQDAPVTDMIFSVGAILQFVTEFMTLEPGDLIATGTPPGVGPVQPGDVIQVEVPGLGILENSIVAE